MKAKLLIILAAVTMLFTACNPEEDNVGKNELTWNGETRALTAFMQVLSNGTYYFGGFVELEENAEHPYFSFSCDEMTEEGINKTYDLAGGHITDQTGYWIWANKFYSPDKHWYYKNQAEYWGGHINGTEFENASIFKSGTMTTSLDDKAFSFKLDGVLKDDDTFTVELYIPREDFINR